eukprot:TRINITY_DN55965_c0_g1_i1.p1 TRINITY_DN55965_c0_g1~~TRINITY_DN55965_c0_g1_i1.p1  ORF type:complete len:610 (+),score=67.69 TRINITY_DN55965_c0_g1_i1:69-1898(+)
MNPGVQRACATAAAAVLLLPTTSVEGRSQGLLIVDEIRSLGAILLENGAGEFSMLWDVPAEAGTSYTTRQQFATQPAVFPSILTWTAMPLAPRLRNFRQNPDQTWTFELFFGKPWCHSSILVAEVFEVELFVLRVPFGPIAGAPAGSVIEVGLVDHSGGIQAVTPQATGAGYDINLNANQVSVLAQIQSYDPSQGPSVKFSAKNCGGRCPGGSTVPGCGCVNGGSCCRGAGCAAPPPNDECLPCDATRQDGTVAYDWIVTRAGAGVRRSPGQLLLWTQCAREFPDGNGQCDNVQEKVAYAIFASGLGTGASTTTLESYYVWAGVIDGVCTSLPGVRVDYATAFPIPYPLSHSAVFGVQDAENGPNPCQPRLGEVYPDHFNVMVLEDNCAGDGDIGHAGATVSLVVVAWNATTATLPIYSPTPTFSWSHSRSTTHTPSGSATPSVTVSPTRTQTTVPFCLVIWPSTVCRESDGRILWPWLLLLLLLLIALGGLIGLLCRPRPPADLPEEEPPAPDAVCDDSELTVRVQPAPEADVVVTARADQVMVTASPAEDAGRAPPAADTAGGGVMVSVRRADSLSPLTSSFASPARVPSQGFASPPMLRPARAGLV